jgi:hypothetical protein
MVPCLRERTVPRTVSELLRVPLDDSVPGISIFIKVETVQRVIRPWPVVHLRATVPHCGRETVLT